MPCNEAMTTDVITISAEQTVADALVLFDKHNIRSLPVVDENNILQGVFSFSHLLKRILPVSVTLDDDFTHGHHMDLSLGHTMGGAPWLVKRLQQQLHTKIEDVMNKKPQTIHPETAIREGVRLLENFGSPIAVVKDDGMELVGIISSQNIVGALQKIVKAIESGEEINE